MPRADRRSQPSRELEDLGRALRSLRHERDLKQIELATQAGVSEALISQIERGRTNPSWLTLTRIVESGLHTRMGELADRYDAAQSRT